MGRGNSGANSGAERATAGTQGEHRDAIRALNDPRYEDGTYDIRTYQQVSYPRGYQVTFWQIGDDYTPEDYANRVNEFLRVSSDGRTLAGKFGGSPEISFHVPDRATALRLARKYNQISVWDWEKSDQILTGGTGERRRRNNA